MIDENELYSAGYNMTPDTATLTAVNSPSS